MQVLVIHQTHEQRTLSPSGWVCFINLTNMVVVSRELQMRKDILKGVVDQIRDLIYERSDEVKDYGCILIPEGVL